jgi:hypothetical protein
MNAAWKRAYDCIAQQHKLKNLTFLMMPPPPLPPPPISYSSFEEKIAAEHPPVHGTRQTLAVVQHVQNWTRHVGYGKMGMTRTEIVCDLKPLPNDVT